MNFRTHTNRQKTAHRTQRAYNEAHQF